MPAFKLPLSGDVCQNISPTFSFFNFPGGQFGPVTVNLGQSSAPEVEADMLAGAGSYGLQLGKLLDAVAVLASHLPETAKLTKPEKDALSELRRLADEVDRIKRRHGRKGLHDG